MDWRQERMRYQVLRFVYDRVGADCQAPVTGTEIQGALALNADEVLHVIEWLEAHGYVHASGSRPSICLTALALEYLENAAGRRQSLRG